MAEVNKKSGCGTAAIVLGVLALIALPAAFLIPALFYKRIQTEKRMVATQLVEQQSRMMEVMAMEAGESEGAGTVVFQRSEIPRYAPHQRGEVLSREQFVALMIDDLATDLARKEFQASANGAAVNWLLKTGDISEREGRLTGEFSLPYELRSRHHSSGSAVRIECEFLPESKDALLMVRKGEWAVVEGTLAFDGRKVAIRDARIGGDERPPRAERPEP